MEKLLELLNEYEIWKTKDKISQNPNRSRRERYRGQLGSIFGTLMNERESRLSIISKSYGFIKWLVENNKIDFDKCGLDVRHYLSYNERYDKGIVMAENYDNDTLVREFYSPYKQLLMLLSISSSPIDDLISYLK